MFKVAFDKLPRELPLLSVETSPATCHGSPDAKRANGRKKRVKIERDGGISRCSRRLGEVHADQPMVLYEVSDFPRREGIEVAHDASLAWAGCQPSTRLAVHSLRAGPLRARTAGKMDFRAYEGRSRHPAPGLGLHLRPLSEGPSASILGRAANWHGLLACGRRELPGPSQWLRASTHRTTGSQ
jgi:hypothetical protein